MYEGLIVIDVVFLRVALGQQSGLIVVGLVLDLLYPPAFDRFHTLGGVN